MTHKELCKAAIKWLKKIGCRVVISEKASDGREEPDAIGWRSGSSILVECKTSKPDFKKDLKKWWRQRPELGMGNWRFYMCEKGVITESDIRKETILDGWGLIYTDGKKFELVIGPKGNCEWGRHPFKANRQHETNLLISELARR